MEGLPGVHVVRRRLCCRSAEPIMSKGEIHQCGLVGMVPAYAVVADVSGLHRLALEFALDVLGMRRVADEGKGGMDVLDELSNGNQCCETTTTTTRVDLQQRAAQAQRNPTQPERNNRRRNHEGASLQSASCACCAPRRE